MTNKLIIDTSKQNAYVVLTSGDAIYQRVINEKMRVSESLLPVIDELLIEANLELKQLSAICVVTGPGSFTGIRVGIATAKAFAQSLGIKLVAKNSFDVVSDYITEGIFVIKCTNTSVYKAKFSDTVVFDIGVINNEDISSLSNDGQLYQIDGEECVSCETHLIVDYCDIINQYFEKCVNRGEFSDPETVEAFYLQLSQAEQSLKSKENTNEE